MKIFKKWWFWLIIVIFIAGIIGSFQEDDTKPKSTTKKVKTETTASTKKNSHDAKKAEKKEVAEKPAPKTEEKKKDNSFEDGMYKIGTDMPAGEYVLCADEDAYFEVSKDSSGDMDSIVSNDNFTNRSIITVSAGQYLKFNNTTAYPFAQAPKVDVSSKIISDGMYKVGIDLPAGEYKVKSTADSAYIEVSRDSTHNTDTIVSNDNFDGERYITVSNGQYLKLSNAELQLK